jgi:exodeoxyribonuclease VII large subunit
MPSASPEIWTISQLTRRVKGLLEDQIGAVWISGEISNWKLAASGHAYFTLKDAGSQIDAVMFKGSFSKLKFPPANGLEVIAHGRVTVYESRGNYQIVLDDMQPKGLGALQLAFERLKKKLEAEGLFDPAHKKPLPLLPRRIGIVTSPTGAAIRDMLNVLNRRFANVHVILCPTRVQGDGSAQEIVAAIRALDRWGVDVMIVGRGGGSLEDLWAFNEEPVVRAVFEARTPVISAVGHEIDFTLCDFAADLRAPTPSAAAELVIQEQEALAQRIALLRKRLAKALTQRVERARHRLGLAQGSYYFKRPAELVRQRQMQYDELRMRLDDHINDQTTAARQRLHRVQRSLQLLSPNAQLRRARERLAVLRQRLAAEGRRQHNTVRDRAQHAQRRLAQLGIAIAMRQRAQLAPLAGRLNALSPLSILSRGYALAWHGPERTLVRAASELKPGDGLYLKFGEGAAHAAVTKIEEDPHGQA